MLVVHPSVAANSVKELIALARAKPGALNFASFGNGTSNHLVGAAFCAATGVNIVHIPYKGSAPAITDLLGGQVQMTFDTVPVVLPQVRAGKLKALAVATPKRSPLAPEVPTMDEAGVAGFSGGTWFERPRAGTHARGGRRTPEQGNCRDTARARCSADVHRPRHRADRQQRRRIPRVHRSRIAPLAESGAGRGRQARVTRIDP